MTETVRSIATKRLKKPGDWKKVLSSDRAKRLAEDILLRGQLVPVVLDRDMSIRMGKHRSAACQILAREVEAIVRETPPELEGRAQTLAENLHRLHMSADEQAAAIREYVEVQTAIEASKADTEEEDVGWGSRSRSPRTKAVAEVVKVTGKSESTVRKAVAGKSEPAAPELPAGFDTFDLACSQVEIARISALVESHTVALREAKAAKAVLGGIIIAGGNAAFVQAIEQDLTNVIAQLARAIPVSLCPTCKMTAERIADCHLCLGAGVVGKGKLVGVDKKLLARGKDAMAQNKNGKLASIA